MFKVVKLSQRLLQRQPGGDADVLCDVPGVALGSLWQQHAMGSMPQCVIRCSHLEVYQRPVD